MEEILEASVRRQMQLIDCLMEAKRNECISFSSLSNMLNASPTTILKDIAWLNNISDAHSEIEVEGRQMVCLKMIKTSSLYELQKNILKQDTGLDLLISIFMFPFQALGFYSEKIGLSRSYSYNKIKKINSWLKQYNSEIVSEHGSYYIKSSKENLLRRLMIVILLERCDFQVTEIIPKIPYESLFSESSKIMQHTEGVSDMWRQIEICYVYAYLLRENQYFTTEGLNATKSQMNQIREEKNSHEQLLMLDKVKKMVASEFTEKRETYEDQIANLKQYLFRILPQTKRKTPEHINFIHFILCFAFINDKDYKSPLCLFMNRFKLFYLDVEIDNVFVTKRMSQVIGQIETILGIPMKQYKGIILYLFSVYGIEFLSLKKLPPICIVSNLSYAHAVLIQQNLESMVLFPDVRFIPFYSETSIPLAYRRDSLLVSNTHDISANHILLINDYFSLSEFRKVERGMLEFCHNQELFIN